jgi:hypothetical protein
VDRQDPRGRSDQEREAVRLRGDRAEREPATAVAERDGDRQAMVRERSREDPRPDRSDRRETQTHRAEQSGRKEAQVRRDTPVERAGTDRGRGDRGAARADREDDGRRDDDGRSDR